MRYLIVVIVFVGLYACGLDTSQATYLNDKVIWTVKSINTGKYTKVHLYSTINGMPIMTTNSGGYYYKKYNLKIGDTITVMSGFWLFNEGHGNTVIHPVEIDLAKYETK